MQHSANVIMDAMDVDNETNTNYSARKIVIVGEEDLESAYTVKMLSTCRDV